MFEIIINACLLIGIMRVVSNGYKRRCAIPAVLIKVHNNISSIIYIRYRKHGPALPHHEE